MPEFLDELNSDEKKRHGKFGKVDYVFLSLCRPSSNRSLYTVYNPKLEVLQNQRKKKPKIERKRFFKCGFVGLYTHNINSPVKEVCVNK